jgi:hypothetical protein
MDLTTVAGSEREQRVVAIVRTRTKTDCSGMIGMMKHL